MPALSQLVGKMVTVILNPIMALMFAAGTLLFAFGIVEFMLGLAQDSDKKEDGKRHMLYGLAGMFVMVAAWAIVKLIGGFVGTPVSTYGY